MDDDGFEDEMDLGGADGGGGEEEGVSARYVWDVVLRVSLADDRRASVYF